MVPERVHAGRGIGCFPGMAASEGHLRSAEDSGTFRSVRAVDSGGTCYRTGSTRTVCCRGQPVGDFARVESPRRLTPSDSTGTGAEDFLPLPVPCGSGRTIATGPVQSSARAGSGTAGRRTLTVVAANFPSSAADGPVSSSSCHSPCWPVRWVGSGTMC